MWAICVLLIFSHLTCCHSFILLFLLSVRLSAGRAGARVFAHQQYSCRCCPKGETSGKTISWHTHTQHSVSVVKSKEPTTPGTGVTHALISRGFGSVIYRSTGWSGILSWLVSAMLVSQTPDSPGTLGEHKHKIYNSSICYISFRTGWSFPVLCFWTREE